MDYPLDDRRGQFLQLLDVHLVVSEAGKACVSVEITDRLTRPGSMAHGGLVATLLDSALGMAAHSMCPEGHYTVTIQLDVKYTRPARPGTTLTAIGEAKHAGRTTAVSTAEARDNHGKLVATGSATLMYLPSERNPSAAK